MTRSYRRSSTHRPEALRRTALGCACAALVALVGPGCLPEGGAAAPAGPAGPTFVPFAPCAETADYADELVPSSFQIVRQTALGGGIDEVEIAFDVANLDVGDFASGLATPDFSGLELDLAADFAPVPADLPAIAPGAAVGSASNLVVRLPSANVATLLGELNADRVPFRIQANEVTHLAPDVRILTWTSSEDVYWFNAVEQLGIRQEPPPPPYDPGQELTFQLVALSDEAESVLDDWNASDQFYTRESELTPLSEIPGLYRAVRVVDVEKSLEGGGHPADGSTTWSVTVALTDQDPLPDLVETGSFCTGTEAYVEWPVQASRLYELDGDPVEDEARDAFVQPIRFNEIPFAGGDVTVSGQVQGHVLKPSLELRLRDGVVRATADFDTDLSMTAELRAERTVDVAPDPFFLYDLCFPLPDLPAGPISIPMNLQLAHSIGFDGSVTAGAVVGFQKRFQSGFTVGYDGSRAPGDRYLYDPRSPEPAPVEFTPPQLTDDTSASARVSTDIRTTLRVGARYPFCDTGLGAYVEASAYGTLDVDPGRDPWWSLGHGAEALAGIELTIFGLGIASDEAPLATFPGRDTRAAETGGGGGSGPAPPRSEGHDQRWAVAIDDLDVPTGFEETALAELSDGSVVVAARESIARNRVVLLDRHGAFQWSVRYEGPWRPQEVLALPDDTIVVAGSTAWLAKHDRQGNLLWSRSYEVGEPEDVFARCSLRDVAALEEPDGRFGFVVVGRLGRGLITQRDACAFRVDPDGELVWARTIIDEGVQELRGVVVKQDGSLAMVGKTKTGPDPFTFDNPLVLAMSEAGDLEWAKSLPMVQRGGVFNRVVEGPDGVLLMAGAAPRIVGRTGAALLGRIAADGSDPRHALMIQDEAWETLLDYEPFEDTQGGDTAYDEWFDIAPAPGGFVVVGRSGLGNDSAAWAAKVNANLGTEWFTTFDGAAADRLDGVARSGDGLLVSGASDSFPTPTEPDGTNTLWVMKLPFAGSTAFRPEVGAVSRYLAAGIRWSSVDAGVVRTDTVSMDAPLLVAAAPLAESHPIDDLLDEPSRLCVHLLTETGRASALDVCDYDDDGVDDERDNCTLVANADQRDTDQDGYGNQCDPDYNNDGLVGVPDFNVLNAQFGLVDGDPGYDGNVELTGDGGIGVPDFNVLNEYFGEPPGPSGLDCAGSIPCTAAP
ncbi:MAG: hypothetical protein QNK03_08990 [Myxococcota bacterium]|nr:hypothetical protein [Myxococcota bacterium]